jgi:hypothetical protein
MRLQQVNINKGQYNWEEYTMGKYVNAQARVCVAVRGGGYGRIIHSVHEVILYYKSLGEIMLHIL